MASSGPGGTRNCVSCGRSIGWDANVCPYCGHDYRMQMMAPMAVNRESAMPVIGGVLILIAGLIELGYGALLIGGGSFFIDVGFGGVLAVCGAVVVVLGVIALIGGIFAIQRKHFGFAIVGGILGLGGWFIPGLIGLILVAISKDEFHD